MVNTAVLGYPRIGRDRGLKKATEAFWKGEITRDALNETAKKIRCENWLTQKNAGIDFIPSNDFSFYDGMLDMSVLLGAIPQRFGFKGNHVDLDTYFSMARGYDLIPAMEMTKWFDTNYHYIVPEFSKNQSFKLSSEKPFAEYKEAQALGIITRPVLIGPVTYLLLGKVKEDNFSSLELLDSILPVYVSILNEFKKLGVSWVQIDEPVLVLDLPPGVKEAFEKSYKMFAEKVTGLNLMLTTYFGDLASNLKLVASLPVKGVHFDLVRAPKQLNEIVKFIPQDVILSCGVVDGRNIWKSDLSGIVQHLEGALKSGKKENIVIATSCSLLHTPLDLDFETSLDSELKSWLAFSKQKLGELTVIKKALNEGNPAVANELKENQLAIQNRKQSKRIHVQSVKDRVNKVTPKGYSRKSPFKIRQTIQREKLKLPLLPTTTIGSFPQTMDIRNARAKYKSGQLSLVEYNNFLKQKIKETIDKQLGIGIDVLVHGESERNDMVEYFGEMLNGFAFTKNGWVQSYGSRYVKPPVIFGDVSRPKPMTVEWIKYAQSLTSKPVKGMLTGPITILQWSFVRDDQERSQTARQIALALRDEVCDLEKAGISIIQIDEPAIREGLPLRKSNWADYLKWAVECFKLASCGVSDETQIHTHMCYSEFNDIIESIAAMDADVISIETSRSHMELLDAFVRFHYPNEIGPGVYDVHSPQIPTEEQIMDLLKRAGKVLPKTNIWVNPDCGLKTRGWKETIPALKNMVSAAKAMRESHVVV